MLATPADLLARWDARLLYDLAGDDGAPVDPGSFADNPRVAAALRGAAGEVRSAVLKGGRYRIEQLQSLSEDDAAYLKDIICGLAMLRLTACRVSTIGTEVWQELRRDLRERLEEIERGDRVFATDDAISAGLPKADGPKAVDYQRMNLLVDRCRGYYPARSDDLPAGR